MDLMDDIRNLANALADNIEANGHWQSPEGVIRQRECCIVINPAWDAAPWQVRDEFPEVLADAVGLSKINPLHDRPFVDLQEVYDWNDKTPTQEVLDTLRNLG